MYPPMHHVEQDLEKCFRVIETSRFATLISRTEYDVVVTHVPLILDRQRGKYGTLVGHMDRQNPHASYLSDGRAFAIFHGPNAYISPNVYASSQLPTWNSVSVHVRGAITTIESTDALRDSIIKMTELLETGSDPYVLANDDSRMVSWLHLIVGFEIEIDDIIGRFKLSQDKSDEDMLLARDHLVKQSAHNQNEILDALLDTGNK